MARETEIECPSGLRVRLRSIKGKDLDILKDKSRMQSGEALCSLLDACTLEVLNRGIYGKLVQFKWADALVGDSMTAVVGLRSATSGDEFSFMIRCKDPLCKQPIDWSLHLEKLPRKELPPESAVIYLEKGNTFETSCNGSVVHFGLKTGRDNIRLFKLANEIRTRAVDRNRPAKDDGQQSRVLLALANRISKVEGWNNVMDWLDDQDLTDLSELIKKMDEVDCGIETDISVLCSGPNGCGLKQEVSLPLDMTFFKLML